ncbi:hypothetical protein ABZ605_11795 [Streptomyces sp. NPDC012765]|uniref:hypothetical protein n=1 Tax=Streptomyces sp. NPDC012765 TaxID=3155249 RepID=UPI0033CFCCCA
MGPAAHPALPQVRTALAQPRRGDNTWGWNVAVDLEIQHVCQSILTRTETAPATSGPH